MSVSLVGNAYRPSHLVVSFYRDGVSFYLAMLENPFVTEVQGILIAVVVLQIVAHPPLQSIGIVPLRVIHSILACLLVIYVRVLASDEATNQTAARSQIVFAGFPAESGGWVDTAI
ncbi:hypothetical protein C8J57DRAFT_1240496 [Mycena rebaudengoi]|nr:hypothetical protein C8J57DRAFT_1240496 [Mycena rebaudengoi]